MAMLFSSEFDAIQSGFYPKTPKTKEKTKIGFSVFQKLVDFFAKFCLNDCVLVRFLLNCIKYDQGNKFQGIEWNWKWKMENF